MSTAARVPQVDEAVNFRDLALGINDWYNVTPSVRVAIEGLALVVQDQAARLERFEAQFGVPGGGGGGGRPGTGPHTPFGAVHDAHHSSEDMTMLIERVDRLTQELATTKAKLRAVETSRGGANDEMASAAERACDLATQRAETAAREASSAARECRNIEQTVQRAEAAASEATRARDAFSASLVVKTESSESRVRAAAAKAEVRCREASDDVKRIESLVRDIDIAALERDTQSIQQFSQSVGTIRELRKAVFGAADDGKNQSTLGSTQGTPFSTPGGGIGTPGMGRGGTFGNTSSHASLPQRLADVEATTASVVAAIESMRSGESTPATETLGAALQQLHAAVGASLKERPTVPTVRAMIEEQLLGTANDSDTVETFSVLAKRTTAAEETAAANTRRVGVLEDVARGMERRQRRTERIVEDVRKAWSVVSADQETAIIRKIRSDANGSLLRESGDKKYEKEYVAKTVSALAKRDSGSDLSDDDGSGEDELDPDRHGVEPPADKIGRVFGH